MLRLMIFGVMLCASCIRTASKENSGARSGKHTEFASTSEGSSASRFPLSLCKLVNGLNGGAGLYRIDRIYSTAQDPGFIYTELALLEDWQSGSAVRVLATRMHGESSPNSNVAAAEVALAKDEIVGLVYYPATGPTRYPLNEDNRGLIRLHPEGIFKRKAEGGFTNGELFTKERVEAADLGQRIRGLVGRPDCPYDFLPDVDQTSPWANWKPTGDAGYNQPAPAGLGADAGR